MEKSKRSMDKLADTFGSAIPQMFDGTAEKTPIDETLVFANSVFRNKAEFYHWSEKSIWPPHYHRFCEICLYNGEKSFDYHVGSCHYKMHKGDLLYIPPLTIHCAEVAELIKSEPYDRYVLWIWDDWERELLSSLLSADMDHPYQIATEGTEFAFLKKLFEKGCSSYTCTDWQMRSVAAAAQIVTCLSMLKQDINNARQTENDDLLDKAMDYINKNYMNAITVKQVADACFVSKSTLQHQFAERLGTSLYKYVLQKRLIEAECMMRTGKTLKEIFQKVGFADYPSFYRAFRRQYNMSPMEYKKVLESCK